MILGIHQKDYSDSVGIWQCRLRLKFGNNFAEFKHISSFTQNNPIMTFLRKGFVCNFFVYSMEKL